MSPVIVDKCWFTHAETTWWIAKELFPWTRFTYWRCMRGEPIWTVS